MDTDVIYRLTMKYERREAGQRTLPLNVITRSNPPQDVYEEGTFCVRCRGVFNKKTIWCDYCGTKVRRNSRHAKREKKYIE